MTQYTSPLSTEPNHFVVDPSNEKPIDMPDQLLPSLNMNIRHVNELQTSDWDLWNSLRSENPTLVSPFFSREFIETAARLRSTSRVAVLSSQEETVGFLPFEYTRTGLAVPIGGPFNDAHGVIGSSNAEWSYGELCRFPDLPPLRMHAWDGDLAGASPFILGYTNSYLADLAAHPEGYLPFLETERATIFKQRRKSKKMIRDLGPLRLDFDCRSEEVFDQLLEMKSSQYRRTNIFDILSVPWAQRLLRDLWQIPSAKCRGVLSALYAGNTLVAAHYGLREGSWLHYWFPTYSHPFHQYSPGTALFLEIVKQAPALGIAKIDMGYGDQPYKLKLTDTVRRMPYGILAHSRWPRWREKTQRGIANLLKKVPFKEEIKKTVRSYWPDWGRGGYE